MYQQDLYTLVQNDQANQGRARQKGNVRTQLSNEGGFVVPEVEPRRPRYSPWPKWIPRTTKIPLMPSMAIKDTPISVQIPNHTA
jgi:hypothetical protein